MLLIRRWIIEVDHGAPGRPSWDTVGSVVGPRSAEAAVERARSTITGIPSELRVQAIDWNQASAEQQEAAAYEDEMDGRAFGGALGKTPRPGEESQWEHDYRRGNLPAWANTPARGCFYATLSLIWSWAKVIVVLVILGLVARACFHWF